MNLGLEHKVALVTGASRGIGAAIALQLAGEGCDVAVTHWQDPEGARDVVDRIRALGRKALGIEADASDFDRTQSVVEESQRSLGELEILVCNAGVTADRVSWKMSEAEWDRVLGVNLKGCFNYCRAVAGAFRERRRGKIITVSSINALRGKFGQVNYAASKGGIVALTRALARELGRYDVNVNTVAPGMVETELIRSLPDEFREAARDESCLGRLGQPREVADVVTFLASDCARHVTGVCVRVDGGQLS